MVLGPGWMGDLFRLVITANVRKNTLCDRVDMRASRRVDKRIRVRRTRTNQEPLMTSIATESIGCLVTNDGIGAYVDMTVQSSLSVICVCDRR